MNSSKVGLFTDTQLWSTSTDSTHQSRFTGFGEKRFVKLFVASNDTALVSIEWGYKKSTVNGLYL